MHRLGPVLYQDAGGGKSRPSGGSSDPVGSAHWWKLGPQWQQEDVALREQPLPHYHHQIRPVPGLLLPGVSTGQWEMDTHTSDRLILGSAPGWKTLCATHQWELNQCFCCCLLNSKFKTIRFYPRRNAHRQMLLIFDQRQTGNKLKGKKHYK